MAHSPRVNFDKVFDKSINKIYDKKNIKISHISHGVAVVASTLWCTTYIAMCKVTHKVIDKSSGKIS